MVNGYDLSPSKLTQTSEQTYNDFTAKNRRTAVKIVFPQSSKAFVQRPIPFFPEIYRACIYISGILQRFVKNFLNRESLIFSAKDWTKTSLGIL